MEKNKMQTKQKIMISLISSLLISLSPGCTLTKEPGKVAIEPTSLQQPRPNVKRPSSGSVARRFEESKKQGPTVVESAIELSEKYARLSEETAALRQEKQDLITKNRRLNDQVIALEDQLQQTQKELTEANDLMIEMRIELNNWKSDILGFREEMRDADTAQLETLLRILTILGGEVKTESVQAVNKSSAPISNE
jgi:predicted nuclease with TOPRIM domain